MCFQWTYFKSRFMLNNFVQTAHWNLMMKLISSCAYKLCLTLIKNVLNRLKYYICTVGFDKQACGINKLSRASLINVIATLPKYTHKQHASMCLWPTHKKSWKKYVKINHINVLMISIWYMILMCFKLIHIMPAVSLSFCVRFYA